MYKIRWDIPQWDFPRGGNMQNIVKQYDAKVDSKKRITLRDAKYDYYSVTTYDDGSVSLEPKVLMSKNSVTMKEAYDAFLKLRENARKNGTMGMTLDEINKIIYEQ